MADLNVKKNKHMTLDDRLEIQECLNHGMTFKAIGKRIGKDQTTISKEVKKHLAVNPSNVKRTDQNGNPKPMELCPTLLKAPFVCNSCKRRHTHCAYQKQLYNAKVRMANMKPCCRKPVKGFLLTKTIFMRLTG